MMQSGNVILYETHLICACLERFYEGNESLKLAWYNCNVLPTSSPSRPVTWPRNISMPGWAYPIILCVPIVTPISLLLMIYMSDGKEVYIYIIYIYIYIYTEMLTPRKQYQPNAEFDIMFEGLTFQYIYRLASDTYFVIYRRPSLVSRKSTNKQYQIR